MQLKPDYSTATETQTKSINKNHIKPFKNKLAT